MSKCACYCFSVLIFSASSGLAQNVGIGTNTPHNSAVLELKSSNMGLLIPRTSTVSRMAIGNPAKGLMVYDTTTNSFWFHSGTVWTEVGISSAGWSLTGNNATNPAIHFIGTSDNHPLRLRLNNLWAGEFNSAGGNYYIGDSSGSSNTTGFENTAMGKQALKINNNGYWNTAMGAFALSLNDSGYSNTATGAGALYANSTGYYNTAHGFDALYSNTTGVYNTAVGGNALALNTTGIFNTATGLNALYLNTTGNSNTAAGVAALRQNTTGSGNTANGVNALYFNTGGSYNTVDGYQAMRYNTTGSNNVANGYQALYLNTTGSGNTANGYQALYLNNDGIYNTAVGLQSLNANSSGNYNTATGYSAGYSLPNNVDNVSCIGFNAGFVTTPTNHINIGNTSVLWIGGIVNWGTYSDERIKDDIRENVPGLEFINRLRPVTYRLNIHRQNEMVYNAEQNKAEWPGKYDIENISMTGFLAQDVEKAANEINYSFSGLVKPSLPNALYSLRYSEFVVPLVKAVQEQQVQIQELNNEIVKLKESLTNVLQKLQLLEEQLKAIVNLPSGRQVSNK